MVLQNHDTMSVSEREQTKFIHRERRMSIMNEVHDIMNKTGCGSDRKSGHTREGEGMNAKKWDVYVYGDVNIDIVIPGVEKFPEPGQEDEVSVMETFVGGGAALFTLGVGKLGLHPVFQGEVGDDCYGELIRNKFRESHVDDSLLVISKELKTGISLSFTNEKDRSFLTYRGTNEKISIVNVDVEKVKEAAHIHVTGYAGSINHNEYLELLKKIKAETQATVSFDVGWDSTGEGSLPVY